MDDQDTINWLSLRIERLERMVVKVATGKRVKMEGGRMMEPDIRHQPVDWPDLRELLKELGG